VKNILIVEDSKEQAELLAMAIKHFGYNPTIAYSAEEAKEVLGQESYFDLITSDINMSGASGVKFVSELRETGVKTPIIIISALSQKDNMEIALDIGASDYIVKPISLKILKTSLGKYLD